MMSTLRKLVSGIAYVALLALTLHVASDQASAQIRPAYTKNVDEPGRTPYQTSNIFSPSSCSFNSVLYFCPLPLPTVPAGKRLIIEHVSIFVALNAGVPDSLRLQNSFNNNIFWVQPTFTQRALTPTHFFLDRQVLAYYEPGDTPKLLLAATGSLAAAEATVHGYLIDATN
jgi:hypothetical protein